MDNFIVAVFVGVFLLGCLQGLVPLVIGLVDAILLAVLRAPWRLASRWRAVPLLQKNRARVSLGAGGVVGCLVVAAHGFPVVGAKLTAGIAAFALFYLAVGIVGTLRAERLTFDFMVVFWRCAFVIGCIALLIYAKLGAL
jgi:hypothetical protein